MANSFHPHDAARESILALAPHQPPHRTLRRAWAQYLVLARIFLTEYRNRWFLYIFFSLVWPLAFISFIHMTSRVLSPEQTIFILGGNMATGIAFGPTFILMNKIGQGRESREYAYWTTLPLPALTFVLAVIVVALLLTLPGLLGTYLLGMLLLHLALTQGLILLLLIPLSALPLAGFGALLGSYAPNGETAGTIGNILLMTIGFLSPMFIPLARLPLFLRILAFCFPTTYVADAFRAALGGQTILPVFDDILIIAACSLISLLLVHHRLDWRTDA